MHARWNPTIIEPLVRGAQQALFAYNVKAENVQITSCPGSFELPFTVQRMIAASQAECSSSGTISATDLLSAATSDEPVQIGPLRSQFDAIIAIGVLIKGETMHFEYICDAVSHGLMRVQLDSNIPVIFGVLTVLSEEQAQARAGLDGKTHNHGVSWGEAAVEMSIMNMQTRTGIPQ